MESGSKNDGVVKNLAERVKKGEISPKEAKEELNKMGLQHEDYEGKYKKITLPSVILGLLFILIPFLVKFTGLPNINSFVDLSFIFFHPIFFLTILIILIFLIVMGTYAGYQRHTKGGTKDGDEPIILIKGGPYAVMRHPTVAMLAIMPLWFSMIFSFAMIVPFTIISVTGNILLFVAMYFLTKGEEEFSIKKWGEEYRKYQKDVPGFNFLVGFIKWAKRKSK